MRIELKTGPGADATTVAGVKAQTFFNAAQQDAQIAVFIPGATDYIEHYTGRRLIDQSVYIYYDRDEYADRLLAYKETLQLSTLNVSSIVEVLTYDDANASTIVTASDYRLMGNTLSSSSKLAYNETVTPSLTNLRSVDAVRIEVVAGYGVAEANLPNTVLVALNQLVAYWSNNSSMTSTDSLTDVPLGFNAQLLKYVSPEKMY